MITGRIEVHPIEVRGLRFTVLLDDDGTFHAYTDAGLEAATAATRQGLASALSKLTKQALGALSVPVTRLVDGKARHGEVTGIHPTTRNFQVRWADGQRDQLSAIRDSNLLGGMTEDEGREWARLTEAAKCGRPGHPHFPRGPQDRPVRGDPRRDGRPDDNSGLITCLRSKVTNSIAAGPGMEER